MKNKAKKLLKVILWHFLKVIFGFYGGGYIGASILHGIYRLDTFDIRGPFDFKNWVDFNSCCSYSSQSKVNLITMVASYITISVILTVSVRKAHWLYILLISIVHLIISCIVMRGFPVKYSYWVCLGISAFVSLAIADICVFFLEDSPARPTKSTTSVED